VTAGALLRALALFADHPSALWQLLTWPRFSLTSYQMVRRLARGGLTPRTVIDVGANAGQFAVAAAKLFPSAHVHSFEPIPQVAAALQRNVAGLRNVTVYPLALGARVGRSTMYVNSSGTSSSLRPLAVEHRRAFPSAREVMSIEVPVATLDSVFRDVALPRPVLLKLDVQGSEADAVRGGVSTLAQVDFVVAETSFKPLYDGETLFPDLVGLLRELGFEFVSPVGWLEAPRTGEILQIDALFRSLSGS